MKANCDRRKSRAARTLLIHKTLPILQHHWHQQQTNEMQLDASSSPSTPATNTRTTKASASTSTSSLSPRDMQLYRDSLMELMTHPDTCILNPKRDIFWDEELHYTTVKPKLKTQQTLASTIATLGEDGLLHKCHVCGKTFYSRYYLDKHMENVHDNKQEDTNDQWGTLQNVNHDDSTFPIICPAITYCKLLGGKLCDYQALQEEPYYARGVLHYPRHHYNHKYKALETTNNNINDEMIQFQSEELPSSPMQVQRNYQRLIHSQPCKPLDMEQSREFCRKSIKDCFQGGGVGDKDVLSREIMAILCDTHSCGSHLQQMLDLKSIQSVHVLKQEWEFHQNELEEWGWGFIVLLLSGLGYALWNEFPRWSRSRSSYSRRKNYHHLGHRHHVLNRNRQDTKRQPNNIIGWWNATQKHKRL